MQYITKGQGKDRINEGCSLESISSVVYGKIGRLFYPLVLMALLVKLIESNAIFYFSSLRRAVHDRDDFYPMLYERLKYYNYNISVRHPLSYLNLVNAFRVSPAVYRILLKAIKNESLHHPSLTRLLLRTTVNYVNGFTLADSTPDSRKAFYEQYVKELDGLKEYYLKKSHMVPEKKSYSSPDSDLRNLFVQNPYGQSDLHLEVSRSNVDRVRKLLASKSDPNLRDVLGRTPFTISCEMGNIEMAKVLCAFNALVNTRDSLFGFTPLISAIGLNNIQLAKFLIASGANVDLPDFIDLCIVNGILM